MIGLHFFVDDISEGIATLLLGEEGEQRLRVSLSALPAALCEGDYLLASFTVDGEKKREVVRDIDLLMGELGDHP